MKSILSLTLSFIHYWFHKMINWMEVWSTFEELDSKLFVGSFCLVLSLSLNQALSVRRCGLNFLNWFLLYHLNILSQDCFLSLHFLQTYDFLQLKRKLSFWIFLVVGLWSSLMKTHSVIVYYTINLYFHQKNLYSQSIHSWKPIKPTNNPQLHSLIRTTFSFLYFFFIKQLIIIRHLVKD